MSGVGVMECPWAECDRKDLSPQGYDSHETWCDHNPRQGISRQKQKELNILESEGGDEAPDPDQRGGVESSLPPRRTPSANKNTEGTGADRARTDGGTPEECPLCEEDDVMKAGEAKEAYNAEVEQAHPKAILGYELAKWACTNPTCAALWGPEYEEPLPMEAIVNA